MVSDMAKSPSDGVAARAWYGNGLRATLAIVAVVAGLASGQALAADAQVKIANFTFDPPILTVKAGTTVTWVNGDDIPHVVLEKGSAQARSTPTRNSRRPSRLPALSSISAPSTRT